MDVKCQWLCPVTGERAFDHLETFYIERFSSSILALPLISHNA
jgi:hypothetical protein